MLVMLVPDQFGLYCTYLGRYALHPLHLPPVLVIGTNTTRAKKWVVDSRDLSTPQVNSTGGRPGDN